MRNPNKEYDHLNVTVLLMTEMIDMMKGAKITAGLLLQEPQVCHLVDLTNLDVSKNYRKNLFNCSFYP